MEVVALTGTQHYTRFFQLRILINVEYWRDYLANNATDIPALDAERDLIIKAIGYALELQEEWPMVYELITSFSSYIERRGYWASWNQRLDRAIEVAQCMGDLAGATTLSVLLARLLQRQGKFKEAINCYRSVIPMARRTGNLFEEARACTNLGYLYIEQGHWSRAEILCCHALTIFESINSDHGRAHTENHLGFLYTRQGLWDRSQEHLEQACAIWQSMGDHHGLMRGFINLGVLYNEMGGLDQALVALKNALQYAQLAGEEVEIGKIYLNIGAAHQLKGEPEQAELYAWQAAAIFKHYSHPMDLALAWFNLGRVYTDLARWEDAQNYLEAALQACQQLNYEYGEIKALIGFIEYELARKNLSQAIVRLSELEDLVQAPEKAARYRYLQSLLTKYHYSLAGQEPAKL